MKLPGVPLAVAATVATGIALDATLPRVGAIAAGALSWSVLAWVWWRTGVLERRRLAVCVVVATLGELFLLYVWGVYAYRDGSLPVFVPAGHALAYAAADDLSNRVPGWLGPALVTALAPYVVWAWAADVDRQAAIWYTVLASLTAFSRERRLYTTLSLVALAIEAAGVCAGSWHYFARDRVFGLSTTSLPLCAGGIYCLSIAIVFIITPRQNAEPAETAETAEKTR